MARMAKKRAAARTATAARASAAASAEARANTEIHPTLRPATVADVVARKLVPNPETDQLLLPSLMEETNGGGSIEQVPGFNVFRAVTSGFATRRVAGPTTVMARPDGGFFSEGGLQPPLLPTRAVGSSASKPENVIGVDSRVMVTDTSDIPWRCICHLEVEYEFGPTGYGTGFLIGPRSVLTAAHVLDSPARDGSTRRRKARQVRVIPGRNGTLAPYGFFVSKYSDWKVPEQWLANGDDHPDRGWDFAIIAVPNDFKTEDQPTAERLGYFGLKCFGGSEESKVTMLFVNNAGYPYEADKAYGTLWYNAGRVRTVEKTYIEYMVDTEGGQSGSPVYYYDKDSNQRYVIAVHTTGDFVNRGLRITEEVFRTIKGWVGR
jgi:glutamyl endopeptidase